MDILDVVFCHLFQSRLQNLNDGLAGEIKNSQNFEATAACLGLSNVAKTQEVSWVLKYSQEFLRTKTTLDIFNSKLEENMARNMILSVDANLIDMFREN